MDKLSPAVLQAFGLSSRGIKKEKGQYLCNSENGLVKVHITNQKPESILMQHKIKEFLVDSFPETDRFILTKDEQPYISIGREMYIATAYPSPQTETNLENEDNIIGALLALAKLHLASRSMPPFGLPEAPLLTDNYSKKLIDLTHASKLARRGSRMSDFDVAFIKHVPRASQTINKALDHLEKTNYLSLHSLAASQHSLCHNALKEENLPVVNGSTYIINFAYATIDIQLCDLAAFIRRYAQRSSRAIPITCMLETYAKINPLPNNAIDIIYPQLIFPWAFAKLATQYYSKKRNWTPNGLINSMESVLDEWDAYDEYVDKMK